MRDVAPGIDPRLSVAVPRYTSYPTAPQFHDRITSDQHAGWLRGIGRDDPISLYIHIPFCDRLCWFCGCNTKQVLKYAPVKAYLGTLYKEMALVRDAIGGRARVSRLHLGGGSPSLLTSDDFQTLSDELRTHFAFEDDAEISVELDPNDITDDTWVGLQALGLTRASLGVQDFDPKVQVTINRVQTYGDTREVCLKSRETGATSLNIDALYGLPHQSVETVMATIRQVIELNPDRIALFGYAHVPWVKTHQRMIPEDALPGPQERMDQAQAAEKLLVKSGYVKIGIDHFAKPDDSLAQAAKAGTLRRNFQGYTTDSCATLVGLGGSSISRFDQGYIQNIVPTGQYLASIRNGRLPTSKGFEFSTDDRMRSDIIERLMCTFSCDFDDIIEVWGDRARTCLADAVEMANGDLSDACIMIGNHMIMQDDRRHLVRIVASRFDAYFQDAAERYSKAV